jgi:indolepyruvate ferredoxin oxidoreductase
VVTDDPRGFDRKSLPREVEVRDRHDLLAVETELMKVPAVTAILYVQTCAAERRRRRKRGEAPDPAVRVFINERVCENCGDCSAKSNCMSVVPVETAFGRKRRIDQSACNKDLSCVEGFCPSFVTVQGGALPIAKADADPAWIASLPEPEPAPLTEPCSILIAGVGGTGVVTLGALIGAAAAREGKNVTALDMAGLAQKGGPVTTHIRIAPGDCELFATRIASGETAVLIGCDLVVSASPDTIGKLRPDFTRAVVNNDFSITSEFVRTFAAQARSGDLEAFPDPVLPQDEMESVIAQACGPGRTDFLPAARLAMALMGDAIATNPFLLGYAHQKGLLPLSTAAILRAIEDHKIAVAQNRLAFHWGRRAAHDYAATVAAAKLTQTETPLADRPLPDMIAALAAELRAYQNERYAARFLKRVSAIAQAERAVSPATEQFSHAYALNLFKLMATKDEYEVARLYTQPEFMRKLRENFAGDFSVTFHFAPPLLGKHAAQKKKWRIGAWALPILRGVAALRSLRGSWLDPFRFSEDRKLEHELLRDYERMMDDVAARLTPANLRIAAELAALPQSVRGYGPVKARYVASARRRQARLLTQFAAAKQAAPIAAE